VKPLQIIFKIKQILTINLLKFILNKRNKILNSLSYFIVQLNLLITILKNVFEITHQIDLKSKKNIIIKTNLKSETLVSQQIN
jgi:hypothetical protein